MVKITVRLVVKRTIMWLDCRRLANGMNRLEDKWVDIGMFGIPLTHYSLSFYFNSS